MNINNLKKYFLAMAAIITFAACTPQKDLIYFQTDKANGKNPQNQIFCYDDDNKNSSPEYKLQPHDMVYVQMFSALDDEVSKLFGSNGSSQANSYQSDQNLFLSSYEVDDDGNITLPTIGEVNVLDLTLDQTQEVIRQKAEEFTRNMVVVCKMVSFKINVAGEVNRPGTYTFYQPSVTIFDALLAAGDLTYDGNREKIRIVRKTDKADLVYTVDIRKFSVLQDKKYYLRPGDIVYVEPNKTTKNLSAINRPLGTISSVLGIVSAVCSVIAIVIAYKK